MPSVFLMCNPLMDLIISAQSEWLKDLNAVPGSMNLVDYSIVEKILNRKPKIVRVPGGSGANTARGIAWLRGETTEVEKPAYLGAVGEDEQGKNFSSLLEKAGVESFLAAKNDLPTGVSAILVTPDHERTMFTHLGACRLLDEKDLPLEAVKAAKYFYLTGYNWDTPNQESAAKLAAAEAKRAGVAVCLDVADPFVANRYRDALLAWIPGTVSVLFANRDELRALTGKTGSDDEVLAEARKLAPLVVMKIGKDGCLIAAENKAILKVPGERVVPKDTTAAGDSFAAGFLYALLLGKSHEVAGRLANRVASAMVTVEGCNYDLLDRKKVREILEKA